MVYTRKLKLISSEQSGKLLTTFFTKCWSFDNVEIQRDCRVGTAFCNVKQFRTELVTNGSEMRFIWREMLLLFGYKFI